jgi:hypothetical protein
MLWKKFRTSDDIKVIANQWYGALNMVIRLRMGFLYDNEADLIRGELVY